MAVDALDYQNPKQALTLCQKALKKHPNNVLVKSLMSISLTRLGKIEEVNRLLGELINLSIDELDEGSIYAITLSLKELGKNIEVVQLYERVHEVYPRSDEAALQLFLSYSITKQFQKQYQLSVKLFKSLQQPKYLYWGIACLLLQNKWDVSEDNKNGIYLKLALKLCEKIQQLNCIASMEEVSLLSQVYEELGMFEESYKIACLHPLYSKYYTLDLDKNRKCVELLIRMKNWTKLFEICSQLVEQNYCSDWLYIAGFLDASYNILNDPSMISTLSLSDREKSDADSPTLLATSVKNALIGFYQKLFSSITSNAEGKKERGEMIAYLDLVEKFPSLHRDFTASPAPSLLTANQSDDLFVDAIIMYFESYFTKEFCLVDLNVFIKKLSPIQLDKLIEKLRNKFSFNITTKDDCEFAVAFEHLLRLCRKKTYKRSYSTDLLVNLPFRSEKALFLAAIQYLDDYDGKEAGGGERNLLAAYLILNYLSDVADPTNFRYKLHLLILSQRIGLFTRSFELFEQLSVKNIQLDTLCYLVVENAADLGHFTHAIDLFQRAFSLYNGNKKECGALILQAFRSNAYCKGIDFYTFQSTLENSIQWLLVEGEIVGIEPLLSITKLDQQQLDDYFSLTDIHSEKVLLSPKELETLTDNRDRAWLSFEPGQCEGEECWGFVKEMFFRKNANWAQALSLFPRLLKSIQSENWKDIEKRFDDLKFLTNKHLSAAASPDNIQTDGQLDSKCTNQNDICEFLVVLFEDCIFIGNNRSIVNPNLLFSKSIEFIQTKISMYFGALLSSEFTIHHQLDSFNDRTRVSLLLQSFSYLCLAAALFTIPKQEKKILARQIETLLFSPLSQVINGYFSVIEKRNVNLATILPTHFPSYLCSSVATADNSQLNALINSLMKEHSFIRESFLEILNSKFKILKHF